MAPTTDFGPDTIRSIAKEAADEAFDRLREFMLWARENRFAIHRLNLPDEIEFTDLELLSYPVRESDDVAEESEGPKNYYDAYRQGRGRK